MFIVVKGSHRIRNLWLSLSRCRLLIYVSINPSLYVVVVGFEDLWPAGAEVGRPGRDGGSGLQAGGMAST